MTTARWLLRRHRRPDAPIRLYLFPHSGGSAGEYLRWSDDLPAVEVFGVQAPGRGGRLAEPAPTSMAELVDALVSTVEFAGPYAFFGHSLGAAVAYETAVALRDRGRPGPCGLYLSAFEAPHARRPGLPVHGLDEPALIAAVEQRYGPLPAELHEDPEWRRLVLGGLRADLQIVHGYRHSPTAPLPCPITALGGTEDWVAEQDLAGWARYTTGAFALRLFAGDHFYFREQRDDVLGFLGADLAHAAERADRAVPGAAAVGPAAAVPRPAA
jgi:surfactin synthase thioesterase subunit